MNSVSNWIVLLICLVANSVLVAIFIDHTKKVQKRYEDVKNKFTSYLADLDRKNSRLYEENQKLKRKIKPKTAISLS